MNFLKLVPGPLETIWEEGWFEQRAQMRYCEHTIHCRKSVGGGLDGIEMTNE